MAQKIVITIDDTGGVEVEVNGVGGKSCQDLTRELESMYGKTVQDVKTKEFYGAVGAGQKNQAKAGQ